MEMLRSPRKRLKANWEAYIPVFRTTLLISILVILYLATAEETLPAIDNLNDKVSHIFAFAALSFLADYAFPVAAFRWTLALLLLALGVGIEVIQHFLPYREASWLDILADVIGILIYFLLQPVVSNLPWLKKELH